uniref:Uncharacterized protein n=1 Tax=Panagrolaimus sp. ES5 TaxID=591445 RepID=A0AC34GC63_9BILA
MGSQPRPCPIDKEKCNEYVAKMKELYGLIKAAEEDDEKWLHWVTQVENEKFIRVNVENRLLKDMSNKKLWKLYISYLKENNQKEMLRIYSHYCRQFADDEELVREYWKAVRSYNGLNPITVHFKTLFHFETHDVDLNGVEKENVPQDFNSIYAIQKKDDKPKLEIFFNPNNALVQSWPFVLACRVKDECAYVENSIKYNPTILPKFVNSGVGEDWVQQIPKRTSIIDDKSLVITTSLSVNYIHQSMLSKLIQEKFFKCEAKHIDIMTQKLTEKEFDFLVGHGNVESCYLVHVQIFKDDGQLLLIEEIMAKMPKLKDF